MGFSTSASFFFFFSVVVTGMDMGLLGWCFFSGGGGWGGYGFATLRSMVKFCWVESDGEEERGRNIIEE